MAYADSFKQKEYQRQWAREKRTKDLKAASRLSNNVVTWAQLTYVNQISNLKTWEECISKAKDFVVGRKVNRLAIAELALRACIVKHGGDRRTKRYQQTEYRKTLKSFGEEVGINHKTIHNWIAVKREVIDHLPKDFTVDYTAAKLTYEKRDEFSGDVVALYKKFTNKNGAFKKSVECRRRLNDAAVFLTK